MVVYTFANTEEELFQILQLQSCNLSKNITEPERQEQGFLSVQHSLEELKEISGPYKHIIAKDNNRVVGFALVMLRDFRNSVETLKPMFDLMDELPFQGKKLKEHNYLVMGQICIDKDFRGQGLFKGLYYQLKNEFQNTFTLLVTEVATSNIRSTNAHKQMEFKSLKKYVAPDNVEWDIVYWDWN